MKIIVYFQDGTQETLKPKKTGFSQYHFNKQGFTITARTFEEVIEELLHSYYYAEKVVGTKMGVEIKTRITKEKIKWIL